MRHADDAFPVISKELRQRLIADVICASMAEMHQQLVSVVPGGRFLSRSGVFAFMTGIPAPMLNGVWFERSDPEMTDVVSLLDEVSRARMPSCLRLRADTGEKFTELATARGMELKDDLVLMASSDASSATAIPQPPGLTIRQLPPEQASRHGVVVAAAHAVDENVVLRVVTPNLLRPRAVRCYIGEVDGQPVTTALSVTLGLFTGIFNVGTIPAASNLGFASAVTARALADGLAAGSEWCWLEATATCLPMFRRLGFHAIEPQQYWVSAG